MQTLKSLVDNANVKVLPLLSYLSLVLLTLLGTSGLTGCANMQRWKEHQKEHNNPQPTKYEAPYAQIRETTDVRPDTQRSVADLPESSQTKPQVIEPETFVPGKSPALYAIKLKDKPGFVLSPYAPDRGLVDVRGFPEGGDVRDPYTGKIMKVPFGDDSGPNPNMSGGPRGGLDQIDLMGPSNDMPIPLPDNPPMLRP